MKQERLGTEPDQSNPDVCTIVFRLPIGGERLTRRFLKEDKIEILYDYIDSLGDKVSFESTSGNYVIMQSMPKKEYREKDKTLQQEGLFPRAMLQIKEDE
jgi:FAS-associated factor 2